MMLEVLLETYLARRSFPFAGEAKSQSVFLEEEWGPTHNLSKSTSQYFLVLRFKEEQNRIPVKTEPVPVLTPAVRLSERDRQGKSDISLHIAVFLLDTYLCKQISLHIKSKLSTSMKWQTELETNTPECKYIAECSPFKVIALGSGGGEFLF